MPLVTVQYEQREICIQHYRNSLEEKVANSILTEDNNKNFHDEVTIRAGL